MKQLFIFLLLLFTIPSAFAQDDVVPQVKITIPDRVTYSNQSDEIYGDVVISNYEPLSEMAGVKANDGNLYVALNDTQSVPGYGLIVKKSTDNGLTWSSSILSVSPAIVYSNLKLTAVGDSVLCTFRINTTLWIVNVKTGSLYKYLYTNVKAYDIVSTQSNSLYLFIQSWQDNFFRESSTDYGRSWNFQNISNQRSGEPQVSRSVYGDTILVTFRDSLASVPSFSKLKQFKYKESAPGVLTSLTSVIVLPNGADRGLYKSVVMGNLIWFIYTENVGLGTTAIYRKVSTNGGLTYSTPIYTDRVLGKNCYWFDALPSLNRYGMMNMVYYSDSLQSGDPTISSDKMVHINSWDQNPFYFNSSEVYSQHIPIYSSNYYKPVTFEFPGEAYFGTLWVGKHGSDKIRVYFDKLHTGEADADNLIEITSTEPASYNLKQNYPNPFNPSTSISFSLKNDGFTSLKIYNMLGQEITSLVNENLAAGAYSYTFNAYGLPSGAYFYRLTSGNFSEIKKMLLVK